MSSDPHKRYSDREISSDYKLWEEFIDPDGLMSERDFELMGLAERLEFIKGCKTGGGE